MTQNQSTGNQSTENQSTQEQGPPNPSATSQSTSPPDSSAAVPGPAPVRMLRRDPDGPIGGVATGLARYFDIDVTLVRLAFVLTFFTIGTGPLFYLIAWIVIPKAEQPAMRMVYTPPPPKAPKNVVPDETQDADAF
jgi:phage shock protein PspC (stress-responsive transcriptional regulator)